MTFAPVGSFHFDGGGVLVWVTCSVVGVVSSVVVVLEPHETRVNARRQRTTKQINGLSISFRLSPLQIQTCRVAVVWNISMPVVRVKDGENAESAGHLCLKGPIRDRMSALAAGYEGCRTKHVWCKTSGKKIIAERAMYWNNRGAGTDTVGGYGDDKL